MDSPVEILLVEDNEDDAELTLRSLRKERLGNRIEHVRDGEQALDFIFCRGAYAQRTPAALRLVLLDLKMPKVDGMEVLGQVKADPRTRSIPVVVMTSSREEPDIVRCYALGANSYIQKPVDFEEFRAAVKSLGLYWLVVNQSPPVAAKPRA